MRVSLEKRWTEKLLALPESGMGYQRVRLRLKDGRTVENAVVLNSQVLELPEDTPQFGPADIADMELASSDR